MISLSRLSVLCTDIGGTSQVSDYSRILVLPTRENIYTQAATQLLSAAQNGDLANVRRLLTEGHVDVNVTDEVGVHRPGGGRGGAGDNLPWAPNTGAPPSSALLW